MGNNNTIAFLIQAYSDSNALKKLIRILLKNNDSHIFVHLDKKSDLTEFYINNKRVHFIEKREMVSWAGYAQGKLIFNLIDAAVQYKLKFDYYCFLSESDYPVYEGEKLFESIIKSNNIFLNCSRLQSNKIEKYWFYDFNIKSSKINKYLSHSVNAITEILYRIRLFRKKPWLMINGKKAEVFFSSPFWKYSYKELRYIDMTFKNNPTIEKYFKHSFAPCELMVPTIIANSKFGKNICYEDDYINLNQLSAICFFKYDDSRVNVLTDKDFENIIKSGKPFMRKVKKNYSDLLIQRLEEYNNTILY